MAQPKKKNQQPQIPDFVKQVAARLPEPEVEVPDYVVKVAEGLPSPATAPAASPVTSPLPDFVQKTLQKIEAAPPLVPQVEEKPEPEKEIFVTLPRKEVQEVLQKYNVTNPNIQDAIKSYLLLKGTDIAEEGAGSTLIGGFHRLFSEGLLLGIPGFAAKKIIGAFDDNAEKAMDELADRIRKRQSAAGIAVDIASGLLFPAAGLVRAGKLTGVGAKAALSATLKTGAIGAASGAASMLAQSKEGEELRAAGEGAIFGLAFAGVMSGAIKLTKVGAQAAAKIVKPAAEKLKPVMKEVSEMGLSAYEKALDEIEKRPVLEKTVTKAVKFVQLLAQDDAEDFYRLARGAVSPKSFKAFRDSNYMYLKEFKASEEFKELAEKYQESKSYNIAVSKLKKKLADMFEGEDTQEVLDDYLAFYSLMPEVRQTIATMAGGGNIKTVLANFRKLAKVSADLDSDILTARIYTNAKSSVEELAKKTAGVETWRDKAFKFISANQWYYRELEDKYHIPFVSTIHKLAEGKRLAQTAINEDGILIQALARKAKKLKISAEDLTRYIESEGQGVQLSKEGQEIAEAIKQMFNNFLWKGRKDYKINIKDVGSSYVPRTIKPHKELVKTMIALENKVLKKLGLEKPEEMAENIHDLIALMKRDPEAREYYRALSYFNRRPIKTANELFKARGVFTKRLEANNFAFGELFNRALDRTEEYPPPDIIRDMDIFRNLYKYSVGLHYRGHVDPAAKELNYARLLIERFDGAASDYIKNNLADTYGRRFNTIGAKANEYVDNVLENILQRAEKADSVIAKGFYNLLYNTPSFFNFLSNQLYAYYMGARVDNVVRNLTQPFTLSASIVGRQAILEGWAKTVYAALTGKGLTKTLIAEGHLPPRQAFEAEAFLKPALERSLMRNNVPLEVIKKGIDAMNKTAMFMYTKSDVINRHVTKEAAEAFIKKAWKRPDMMQKYLSRLPRSYQSIIRRAHQSGDMKTAIKAAQRHLLAETQFNYDKVSMAEYGRFMGSWFSMFSKWPTEIGGELAYRTRGAAKFGDIARDPVFLNKFMGPLIYFGITTAVLPQTWFVRQVFGGLKGAPPATAIMPHEGRASTIVAPPILETAGGFIYNVSKGLQEGNMSRAFKAGKGFIPGAVWFDFITEDLERWDKALKGKPIKKPRR